MTDRNPNRDLSPELAEVAERLRDGRPRADRHLRTRIGDVIRQALRHRRLRRESVALGVAGAACLAAAAVLSVTLPA